MSKKDLDQILEANDDDLNQILQDIGIEENYVTNALTQNVTSTEYTSPQDEYFKIPKGAKEIKINNIKPIKKTKPLLALAMAILLLNELNDLDSFPNIKAFTQAVILVAITSGCLKKEKYYSEEEYQEDSENYKSKGADIKKIIGFIPQAKNFIALSVINYVRFNHHYPKEKMNLIKKGLLGLPENEINDFLESNTKNLKLFYSYPFQACKLVNEYAYFYLYINKNLQPNGNDASDITFLAFKYIGDYTCTDTIITLRNEPTTNCFLILDLLFVMVNYFNSHNLLGFLPNRALVKKLIKQRQFLKEHPFQYHPSRFFNKIKFDAEAYSQFVNEFNENIKKIGNLIYNFCLEEGGTLADAKSILKYQYSDLGEYSDLFEIYKFLKEEKSLLSNEAKNKIKEVIKPKIKIPESSDELQKLNDDAKNEIFS